MWRCVALAVAAVRARQRGQGQAGMRVVWVGVAARRPGASGGAEAGGEGGGRRCRVERGAGVGSRQKVGRARADGQAERMGCAQTLRCTAHKDAFCSGAEWCAVHNGTRGIYMRSSRQQCRRQLRRVAAGCGSRTALGPVQWATTVKPRSRGILAGPFWTGLWAAGDKNRVCQGAGAPRGGGTPAGMVDC